MKAIFSNNQWQEGRAQKIELFEPATGKPRISLQLAAVEQISDIVSVAERGFSTWMQTRIEEREKILRAYALRLQVRKTELVETIARETGKPYWEAVTEVDSAIAKIDISIAAYQQRSHFVQINEKTYYQHKPHGVLLVLGPFNFPLHLPNGHIVPALLAGNAIIFKPSRYTPETARLCILCLEEAGVPAGVVSLCCTDRFVSEKLAQDEKIAGILFTGSYEVGRHLHTLFAGRVEKLLVLEMGGNNPLLVWDLQQESSILAACYHIILSAYISAGQRCTCARRLILPHAPWTETLLLILNRLLRQLRVGAPSIDSPAFMGSMISKGAAEDLMNTEKALCQAGAKSLLPLKHLKPDTALLSPGLLDVTAVKNLPDQECFGPLLQVQFVKDFEEAVVVANQTAFGLSAGLLSDNFTLFEMFYQKVKAGVVNFNAPLTGASSAAPFGGLGHSGNQRPGAFYAADYAAYPVASIVNAKLMKPVFDPSIVDLMTLEQDKG